MSLREPLPAAYESAIKTGLIVQGACMLLLVTLLDGGRMAIAGGMAFAAFWLVSIIVLFRRSDRSRKLDLLYLRWGFVVLLAAVFVLAEFAFPAR